MTPRQGRKPQKSRSSPLLGLWASGSGLRAPALLRVKAARRSPVPEDWPGARRPEPGARSQRMTKGFGTVDAVEIHTLLTCRYSLIISCPLSRPMPERL